MEIELNLPNIKKKKHTKQSLEEMIPAVIGASYQNGNDESN